MAAIPDSPDLKAADEAIMTADYSNADYRSCEFKAKIERIAEQYRGGQHQLDLANASPAELFAFCVARDPRPHAREPVWRRPSTRAMWQLWAPSDYFATLDA
jgi:hypothetical protein